MTVCDDVSLIQECPEGDGGKKGLIYLKEMRLKDKDCD
jgi:hypothetical protein